MNESYCNCGDPKKKHYPVEHMKGMWDSSEGQTHSYEDDCVPVHEKPKDISATESMEWGRKFRDRYCVFKLNQADQQDWLLDGSVPMDWVRDFIENLLAAREKELNVQWLITMNEAIDVDVVAAKKEERASVLTQVRDGIAKISTLEEGGAGKNVTWHEKPAKIIIYEILSLIEDLQ